MDFREFTGVATQLMENSPWTLSNLRVMPPVGIPYARRPYGNGEGLSRPSDGREEPGGNSGEGQEVAGHQNPSSEVARACIRHTRGRCRDYPGPPAAEEEAGPTPMARQPATGEASSLAENLPMAIAATGTSNHRVGGGNRGFPGPKRPRKRPYVL